MASEVSASHEKRAEDMEIGEKQPSINNDISLKAGDVEILDEAELFLQENGISHAHLTELLEDKEAEKKLMRRVDWSLMPLLCGTYLLQYIDKQALGYGAVFDLFTSTGMTNDQYSWMASIFYFAYLVAEWPASYMAQHYPTGKVVSLCVICWGTILTCTAACQNFTGLAVCRFLLGVFEAVITPCFMMTISMWYTRKEAPSRAGTFYCFNGVGSMVGGILFYAVGQAKGFDVWRIIFILSGGLTVCWGIILYLFLPDNILSAKRFSTEQKAVLIARTQSGKTGVFSRKIKVYQIKEAFCDTQVWLLFFFVLLNEVVNGGIANFGKLIVKGFTKDAFLTTAYGIPQGAWSAFFVFTGPWCASRFKNARTLVMGIWVLPTLIGAICLLKLERTNKNGLLMAYYISSSFVGSLVIALQMPAGNLGGYTKRVTATALVFLAYCAGNIIGPHAFLSNEAPVYQTGCKTIIGCVAGQIAILVTLRLVLISRNKKRDSAAGQVGEEGGDDAELLDITDVENRAFRYSY